MNMKNGMLYIMAQQHCIEHCMTAFIKRSIYLYIYTNINTRTMGLAYLGYRAARGVTPIGGLVYMCLPGLGGSLRYFARFMGHVL